jgi:hypothetical protein
VVRKLRFALVFAALCCATSLTLAAERLERDPREPRLDDWRRTTLENMRVAAAPHLVSDPAEFAAYSAAGFNTLVVFDTNGCDASGTAWNFKTADEIRAETEFAREHGLPLVLGLAVESYVAEMPKNAGRFMPATSGVVANGTIPQATDDEIRERVGLWKEYGDDVLVGVFPWYDDVFWQNVDVERQRHVYRLIKDIAPDWHVFGMIGEFGFNASDDEVAAYYDPSAFDHLIVLMYPFNVGARVTGFPLDNVASSDPDGDIARYVDRFIARMNERFFSRLRQRQLILLVVQAFYYTGEPSGHIPRPNDIEIMIRRGNEQLRTVAGQSSNHSAAYFSWGAAGAEPVGMAQRADWRAAASTVNGELDRAPRRFQR